MDSLFGDMLRMFRRGRKLTQHQLAVELGLHRNTIGGWERGDYRPESAGIVLELARVLHLDPLETRQLLEASLTALAPHWSVPLSRNPFFTGREEVLQNLHEHLCPDKERATAPSVMLQGLGGIGKTQTALEYAYRFVMHYSAVFWIEAETLETISTSFLRIAEQMALPTVQGGDHARTIAAVQHWLADHQRWLLIWDNVEDLALLQRFLPPKRQGSMLFTTRRSTLGTLAQGIALPTMTPEEGVLLLLHRAKLLPVQASSEQIAQFREARPIDSTIASKLVAAMDGLPLALDQVGAYVEETPCLLEDYWRIYQTKHAALLTRRGDTALDHPASVVATWSLSFEQVGQRNAAAADLLRLCAFLHPDDIPEELFREGAALLGEQLGTVGADVLQMHQVFQTVCDYSLLKRQVEKRTISIHRLVQTVLREQMDADAREVWQWRAIRALNATFPEVIHETWSQCERLLPHLMACVAAFPDETYDQDLAEVLRKTADYLRGRARFSQAEPLYQRALRIEEQLVGPGHLRLAAPLYGLALLLYEQGKYMQAKPLAEQALGIWEQTLDPGDPELARPLIGVAIIFLAQGNYTQAEHLFQRALWIREQALGPAHPLVAPPITNLATVFRAQGKDQQAEAFYLRAIQIQERTTGPEHPQMAYPLYGLGQLYSRQGKDQQAETLYRQALHIREQTLGAKHPYVAEPVTGLAIILFKRGEYTQAEALYRRAVQLCERTLGPEHPETAIPLANLAELYEVQGKDRLAEALYARVVRIREQRLGPVHAETIKVKHGYRRMLARRQSRNGRRAEGQRSVQKQPCQNNSSMHPQSKEERMTTYTEEHPLQAFVAACCELHPYAWSLSSDLWRAYLRWVKEQQERFPLSRRAFTAQLQMLGCHPDRTAIARIWRGIALTVQQG